MLENLKRGDKIVRVLPSSQNVDGKVIFLTKRQEGKVTELTSSTIVAKIEVTDGHETMRFTRDTGTHERGHQYGWLEELK